MIRPTQRVIFEQAENALKRDRNTLSKSEKNAIYKAFNLSLVNHNPQEVAAQNRFYKELKKKKDIPRSSTTMTKNIPATT